MKWNKTVKKKQYFYSLFSKITIFITLIIFALAMFLYVNFNSYSIQLLNASNEKLVKQILNNALQTHDYVKTYTSALFNSPDTAQLMYGSQLPMVDTLSSIRAMEMTLNSSPFIHSAYVYNGREDTYYILGSENMIRKGVFYDEEMVNLLHNKQKLPALVPIPRKAPSGVNTASINDNVFTYVICEYFAENQEVKNALVVNVRMDWIFNTLTSFGQTGTFSDKGNHILLTDREGKVIAHSNESWFMRDLSGEGFMQRIKAAQLGQHAGTLIADVEEASSVVTFVTAELPEWVLVSITPYDTIARTTGKVKTLTLTIGLAVVAMGLLAAFLLSRNLYSPVRRLRASMGQIGQQQPVAEYNDEFHFFQDTLQSAHVKLASLEMFRNSNMDALKQAYLKNLLQGTLARSRNPEADCETFKVNLHVNQPVSLIMLQIDHYSEYCVRYNERDQALLKYAMLNIANEILHPDYRCDSLDSGGDHVVTLLTADRNGTGEELQEEYLVGKIREIQTMLMKYCSLSVSAYLSGPTGSLQDIHVLYDHARELSRYRLIYGHQCVLTERSMDTGSLSSCNIDNAAVSQLLDHVKRGRQDEAHSLYLQLIDSLTGCDYNNIMFVLSYLSASLFNTMKMMEQNSVIRFELDFVSFDKRMKSLETFSQIHEEFRNLFGIIAETLEEVREDKNEVIVSLAMKYIQAHYTDKLLTPNTVAQTLKLTLPYLNRLFRSEASGSVADYITEVRLSRAQVLLRDSPLSVEEITGRVGWENKKYFFTVYKKRFGVTPSEYRLKAAIGELDGSEGIEK
ncbi:MAG: hypothetical protein K0R57_301 [Paenibacillaceae bacterium]|nr:hypothetical protein [Paenibacillaceae bacterium]